MKINKQMNPLSMTDKELALKASDSKTGWLDRQKFADLIRADEREACAKMCDDLDDDLPDGLAGWQYGEAIRARGEK